MITRVSTDFSVNSVCLSISPPPVCVCVFSCLLQLRFFLGRIFYFSHKFACLPTYCSDCLCPFAFVKLRTVIQFKTFVVFTIIGRTASRLICFLSNLYSRKYIHGYGKLLRRGFANKHKTSFVLRKHRKTTGNAVSPLTSGAETTSIEKLHLLRTLFTINLYCFMVYIFEYISLSAFALFTSRLPTP